MYYAVRCTDKNSTKCQKQKKIILTNQNSGGDLSYLNSIYSKYVYTGIKKLKIHKRYLKNSIGFERDLLRNKDNLENKNSGTCSNLKAITISSSSFEESL